MAKIIEVTGLKKAYGPVEAVRGLDFYVEKGAFFAFLGPNGAGKSTTINIISTLLEADSGQVTVNGWRLGQADDKIRSSIGTVFQDHVLDNLLTVRENMLVRGGFYHARRQDLLTAVDYAASLTGVESFLDRRYGQLSGGQKRRADIARALVHAPQILILDEPTTGLDPQTRQNIWQAIDQLRRDKEMTIFLTTHYMEEAARADYVLIIDDGLIAARGTPAELKEKYSMDRLVLQTEDPAALLGLLAPFDLNYQQKGQDIVIWLDRTKDALPVLDLCRDLVRGFQVLAGDMDDVFINITGKEIRQ